jgi:hypothetical protein
MQQVCATIMGPAQTVQVACTHFICQHHTRTRAGVPIAGTRLENQPLVDRLTGKTPEIRYVYLVKATNLRKPQTLDRLNLSKPCARNNRSRSCFHVFIFSIAGLKEKC